MGKRIGGPVAGGRRKQQDCRRDEEAARSREDARTGCLDWNRKGGRREEGARMEGERCNSAAAHTASAANGWRLGVRTEE